MTDTDHFFKRIAIVGLGLLGGSWGLALKKHGFPGRVAGYARRAETLEQALAAGVVDEGFADVAQAVRGADLVILATPVGVILDLLPRLQPHLLPRALITDVGSTKSIICAKAAALYGGEPLFLGGHPMAGKERSGLENADWRLFENARYVLTPLKQEHLADDRTKAFRVLLEVFGARPLISDPAAHDLAVAYLSHLPQLVSSGLASLIEEKHEAGPLPLELAATGFRSMTRLAESPYSVWRDICLTNSENIRAALDSAIQRLEAMKSHLTDRELEHEFRQAQKLRAKLREIS